MASAQGMLPPGVPDFSSVKDFEDEADARIYHEAPEPSSPEEQKDMHPEFGKIEESLREIRKAPPREETEKVVKEPGETEEDDEPLKALYFVRIPKPDFDEPSYDLIQQEFDAQLAQVKLLDEHRRVQQVKRNEAKKDTNRALECLKEANERVNEQRKKLNPYREQKKKDREARGALLDSRRGLEASTEKELDQRIRVLEFQIEHETHTLAEEKDIDEQIKRLKASRPKVQQYERENAAHHATVSQTTLSPSDKEHLEKELKEYRHEQSMYEKMYHDLRDVERKLSDEWEQINSKLTLASGKKDAIYEKLSNARLRRKLRKNEWHWCRDFGKRIRSLVDDKKIEDAQQECEEQTNQMMSFILSNTEYRKEYMAMWSTKRTNPMAIFEDASAEKKKSTSAKPTKKQSALHANVQVKAGQSLADAVVANTLREATTNLHSKIEKEKKVVKETTPEQQPIVKTTEVKPEPATVKEPRAPVPAPATKPKHASLNDDFELPAAIANKATGQEIETKQHEPSTAEIEAQEKRRLERIEAQKKKKAEQARKKKEREAELKEEKVETKIREVPMKTTLVQQKQKPKPQSKKNSGSSNAGAGDSRVQRTSHSGHRSLKRKPKSDLQKLTDIARKFPILIASCITVLCIIFIYNLL